MKKAIFTVIAIVGLLSLICVPEKVTLCFFVDYLCRLATTAWAADHLCQLD